MEEEISRMKSFLTEFNKEQIQSPTDEHEIAHLRIGNYTLEPEDVTGQVIDWVLNYLDNRKCPYSLALSIAKEIAQQISASFPQNVIENAEKVCNVSNVYAEAMSKIPVVCNTFSNQANLESICSTKYATSVFAIKNKRRKMEDRHVVHHDLNALLGFKDVPHQSYYAVFDGHSGVEAASYASAQLHINIAKHPAFFTDTPKAIIEGYQITDLNFLNMCNKWNIKSGCTAVCALIRENTVFLSWLGDSQAILVRGGLPLTITKPHKPDREDEKQRIESLGGHIAFIGTWRVNSLLAVTRAIGDAEHKPYIISEPELDVVTLDGTEDFLILACDGLSDTLTPEEVTSVLYRYLADSAPEEPSEAVAAKLVHQSKLQGSEDNITAIVIFLRDMKDIKENAIKFLSNPMYCAQNHDFMCMNGSMKLFDNRPDSDVPFSKPTVLELNATSSKKLKNAANVMSSAGFGNASYSYQCLENSAEGSFQTVGPSVVDSGQNVFVSQNISASCFAPEATALSELPTPPIDDILASQQFESFYSTDLYKEFNSMQSSQNIQPIDINRNVNMDSESPNDLLSQSSDVIISNVNNMSLLDTENTTSPNTKLSSDEAVGIATDVVSTTIETAVKCISSNGTQDSSPLQSQLNPLAEPFVMKSFTTSEESVSKKSHEIGDTSLMLIEEIKLENQSFSEIAVESDTSNQLTSADIKSTLLGDERLNQSFDCNTVTKCSVDLDRTNLFGNNACDKIPTQDFFSLDQNKLSELAIRPEETARNFEQNESLQDGVNRDISVHSLSNILEKSNASDINALQQNKVDLFQTSYQVQEENKLGGVSALMDKPLENVILSSESSLVENVETDAMNILPSAENTNSNSSPLSPGSTLSQPKTPDKESVADFIESVSQLNQNSDLDNIISGLSLEKNIFPDFQSKCANAEKSVIESESSLSLMNEQVQPQDKTIEQKLIAATSVHTSSSEESNKYELNQNIDSGNASESVQQNIDSGNASESVQLNIDSGNASESVQQNVDSGNASESVQSENMYLIEAEIQSKCEEIQKSIISAMEKSEVPETSSLLEPISLIDIKDELICTEAEVPSDPSIEDSRVETVAVDLKSLPEGIPEAEGVTEDIDSDSEKDGGWSYVKGNMGGSKTKPNEKASKTTKTNDVKSNATHRGKRDILKPNAEKIKVKNVTVEKTKSAVAVKSKNTFDKTKDVASVEKMKSVTSADKAKTLVPTNKTKLLISIDKNKKPTVEKKLDVRTRVLKSTTLTSAAKVTTEKTSRVTITSNLKKETSETSKSTSTVTKSSRPTTLLRTNALATKPVCATVTDQNTASTKVAAKPKGNTALSENKIGIKKVTSLTMSKGQTSTLSKSNPISTRTTSVRPTSTVSTKTSTISTTRAPLLKTVVGETKIKQASSTTASSLRKPLTTAAKKPDVKEVKDSVNKEILAKKTTTTKKVVSANNKSMVSKVSGIAAKSEVGKRNLSKAPVPKSIVMNTESKNSQDASKCEEKIIESVQCKTDETKNTLNIEAGNKNAAEIAQVTEEKFILEAINKEKVVEEVADISTVENGSLIDPIAPVEVETPVTECTPQSAENL